MGKLLAGTVALYLLVRGASETIERSTALARRYEIPDALIAMSVIAVGTSLPEIAAHVTASFGILTGSLDFETASAAVLGGSVGSATTQQLLLVGILLLGYGRVGVSGSFLREHYLPMLWSFGLLYLLALDGRLSRFDGLALLAVFAAYLYVRFRGRERGAISLEPPSKRPLVDAAVGVLSLVVVLASAFILLELIDQAVSALRLGGSMLGVVTIGLAGALPELSTTVESIRRDRPMMALGTLVGSNVVNSLVAVGAGAIISTYGVPGVIVAWDLPFKFLAGLGLWVSLQFSSDGSMGRPMGVVLVVAYLAYVGGRLVLYAGQ